jgi:hypothetical protein
MAHHNNPEGRRARRRRITSTLAARRRTEYAARMGDVPVHTDTRFKKQSPFGCSCCKRKKGQPRMPRGICGSRHHIYTWRQETQELRAAARAGREPDDE